MKGKYKPGKIRSHYFISALDSLGRDSYDFRKNFYENT